MASDSEISLKISAKLGDLTSGMERARAAVSSAVSSMKQALGGFNDGMRQSARVSSESARDSSEAINKLAESLGRAREGAVHLLEALGAFEAIRKFGEWGAQSMELGERLRNLSLETGMSGQQLQVLDFAARSTGTNLQRLTMMTTRLSQAGQRTGGIQGSALAYFGLKPRDLNDTYGALVKIGDKMREVGATSVAARAAFAALFGGRFGMTVLPAIENLTEYGQTLKEFGIQLSNLQITKLWRAQEAFNTLGYVWQQDKAIITAELTPALMAVASTLTAVGAQLGSTVNNSDSLASSAQRLGTELVASMHSIYDAVVSVVGMIMDLRDSLERLAGWVSSHSTLFGTLGLGLGGALVATGNVVGGLAVGGVAAGMLTHTTKAEQVSALDAKIKDLRRRIANLSSPDSRHLSLGNWLSGESFGFHKNTAQIVEYRRQIAAAQKQLIDLLSGKAVSGSPGGDFAARAHAWGDKLFAGIAKRQAQMSHSIAEGLAGGVGKGSGQLPVVTKPEQASKEKAMAAKVAESALAVRAELARKELTLGHETAAQEIATETDLATQRYAIELGSLQQQKAIEGLKPVEVKAIDDQIEELGNQHAAEMIALQVRQTQAIAKEQQTAADNSQRIYSQELSYRTKVIDAAARAEIASGASAESVAKSVAQLKLRLAAQEHARVVRDAQAEIALWGPYSSEGVAAVQKIAAAQIKLKSAALDAASAIEAANVKSATAAQGQWATVFDTLQGKVDQVVQGWLQGTQNMQAVWRKALLAMAEAVVEANIKDLFLGGKAGGIGAVFYGTAGKGGGVAGMATSLLGGKSPSDLLGHFLGVGSGGLLGKLGGLLGITGMGSGAQGSGGTIGKAFQAAQPIITRVFTSVWQDLKAPIESIFSAIFGGGGGVAGGGLMSGLGNMFGGLFGGGGGDLTGMASMLGGDLGGLGSMGSLFAGGGGGGGIMSMLGGLFSGGGGGIMSMLGGLGGLFGGGSAAGGAGIMSMLGGILPIFAGGGIVPSAAKGMTLGNKGSMALLHPREMVLPAQLATGVQRMVAGGGPASASGGGASHFHFSPTVHAMDAQDAARGIMGVRGAVADAARAAFRYGHV